MEYEEEYEMVPLGPVRRLERRIEKVEKAGTSVDFMKEMLEIVRSNQGVIEEIVKIDGEMIKRASELSDTVNSLANRMNEFMSRIEVAGAGESVEKVANTEELEKRMDERLAKLEKRVNTLILSTLSKSKMPVAIRKPMPV